MKGRWIIGVDEVGRGALAGPLVLAAVAFLHYRDRIAIVGWNGKDSKHLTLAQREGVADTLWRHPRIVCAVSSVSNAVIDQQGMTGAAKLAVFRVLQRIRVKPSLVLLDGGLIAPVQLSQLTVIRGDAQLPVIAAASIVAKVHRDRLMRREHQRFPKYGFDAHVGYGTKQHYKALCRHGPSLIHRKSFRLT